MNKIPDNFLKLFLQHYQSKPKDTALIFYPEDKEEVYSNLQFHQLIHSYYEQFKTMGVRKKDRMIIFIKLGPEFYASTMALVALGATPIFLDPKMNNLSKNLKLTQAKYILLSSELLKYRFFIPFIWKFKLITLEKKGLGFKTLLKNYKPLKPLELETMKATDPLIITYTTGSTGMAKAADRNYEVSYHQSYTSLNYWHHDDKTVDITFFPVVVFQNINLGITTVVPNLNKKDITKIDFKSLIKSLHRWKVTRISAAPGYLNALCNELNKQKILSIKKLITGGAPVSHCLSKKITSTFPDAQCNVVYGSTEAEPISFIDMRQLNTQNINSYNVGLPVNEIEVKFLNQKKEFLENETGEIIISGEHVVKSYIDNPDETKKFKIKDAYGKIWHRTGDIGFKDNNGHIHILGRKKHSLHLNNQTRYSLELEKELDLFIPENLRRAIKFQVNGNLSLFIESSYNLEYKNKIKDYFLTEYNTNVLVNFIDKMPVDHRHHWKINYNELK